MHRKCNLIISRELTYVYIIIHNATAAATAAVPQRIHICFFFLNYAPSGDHCKNHVIIIHSFFYFLFLSVLIFI